MTTLADLKTISLDKGQHRFVITYEVGSESAVLDEIVAMVNRPDLPFDWFDAAVLSHQLGQYLAAQLKPLKNLSPFL